MKLRDSFPLERLAEVQANPENFGLLEQVPLREGRVVGQTVGDEVPIVFIDTETTGLEPATDRIIKLGLVYAHYSPSARTLQGAEFAFSEFEDPGFPIPAEASDVNKITDDMVRGKRFDDIEFWFEGDPIVVAHNAGFDRPFFDRRFPSLRNLRWVDTCNGVGWPALGYEGRGLKALLLQAGFKFNGHRAAEDCLALAHLMHVEQPAFAEVLAWADRPSYIVQAQGSPFEVKDILSKRRYRWDGANKVWWREGVVGFLEAELAWLDSLYSHASRRAIVKTQTARDRFKVLGLPRLVLPGSEPLDPEVIAVGTGERKPRPNRDQLLRSISVREDAFRGTKTRDEFRDANMARAQIDLGSKYGIGDGSIFGQPGVALNEWDERQLRNWNEWLSSCSKAVARV